MNSVQLVHLRLVVVQSRVIEPPLMADSLDILTARWVVAGDSSPHVGHILSQLGGPLLLLALDLGASGGVDLLSEHRVVHPRVAVLLLQVLVLGDDRGRGASEGRVDELVRLLPELGVFLVHTRMPIISAVIYRLRLV